MANFLKIRITALKAEAMIKEIEILLCCLRLSPE